MVVPLVSLESVFALCCLAGLSDASEGVVVVAVHGDVLKVPVAVVLKLPSSQVCKWARASLGQDGLVKALLVGELALNRIIVKLLVDAKSLDRHEQVLI